MIGSGRFIFAGVYRTGVVLEIDRFDKENFAPIAKEYKKLNDEERAITEYDFTIRISGVIDGMEDGKILVTFSRKPDFVMELRSPHRSGKQHSTLRGIEHFMFWVQNGRRPIGDEAQVYHSALLEMFAPIERVMNPLIPGEAIIHRKSTSEMNTKEMSVMVDGALAMLLQMEIPKKVADAAGRSMLDLWMNWYEWKNQSRIRDRDDDLTWDQYREIYPYCELCGKGGTSFDPLERMHIVSGGSSPADYEKSWNWLHSHHSHHVEQHGSVKEQRAGWNLVLDQFPHIKGKVMRAFEFGRKKGPVRDSISKE
jgi:hypothetical protein